MTERRRADEPTSAESRTPTNGPAEAAIVAEVLELLAQAIVADVNGRCDDDGCVPPGKEP